MRTVLYILFTIISFTLSAQNKAILKANNLIAQKKYLSAYRILHDSDPNNQDPEIAIAKTNLLLNYHITTNLYHKFGLKDLAYNEFISDYEKNKNIKYNIVFYPDLILERLVHQYPQKYSLFKALGGYYYEVYLKYPNNQWIINDTEVLKKIKTNYLKAYKHNVYDYWSLFGIGYVYLLEGNNEKAISFFEKSIKSNPKYALTYYNLAYAFFNLKEYEKALKYSLKSYEMQYNPLYKAESARLLGTIYRNLQPLERAYECFVNANDLYPKDYNTLLPMLELSVILKKSDYKKITSEIFLLAPDNPTIYKDIMKIYVNAGKRKDFLDFLEKEKRNNYHTTKVLANIYFYTGLALYEEKQWVKSKINFEKSRSLFSEIYNNNHNIFKVINSYTDVLKKK